MVIDLGDRALEQRARSRAWLTPSRYWSALSRATKEFPAPVVALQLDAFVSNAHDLVRRAGGLPIRVASKSIRVREILESILTLPGYRGVLAYSLAEAVWLSSSIDDIVVAYPSVDRAAIRALVTDPLAARRVTILVDSIEHLDVVDAVLPPGKRETVRVCLDLDASWRSPVLGHIGVHRSPIHAPDEARALAEVVERRAGFTLVGMMAYEAQIAGVGNSPKGRPVTARVLQGMQRASVRELRERRAQSVALVREVAELEFVNGGGTGSIESTVADPSVTEVAAGSGLFGPHLFDHYAHFTPAPSVAFALDVVRKPSPEIATLFGGGWIASGPHGPDRSPLITWPAGLRYAPREGAGEVQTPVFGHEARNLRVGDRVWLRHTKSGEVMEHVNEVALVSGDNLVGTVQTYRGAGKVFA